jgi:hypothetical protein
MIPAFITNRSKGLFGQDEEPSQGKDSKETKTQRKINKDVGTEIQHRHPYSFAESAIAR